MGTDDTTNNPTETPTTETPDTTEDQPVDGGTEAK